MSKKEWTVVGVLGAAVVALLACIACLLLEAIGGQSNPRNQVVMEVVLTATSQQPASSGLQPTTTPVPVPTQSVGKVGDRMQSAGIAITVNKVSRADEINRFKPKADNVYLVLDVLIENVDRDEESPYNPLYFLLKDSKNYDYNETLVAPAPSLKSGTLRKGDKARGNVAFEVPAKARGFTVRYVPMVLFGGYQPIRVDLGQ